MGDFSAPILYSTRRFFLMNITHLICPLCGQKAAEVVRPTFYSLTLTDRFLDCRCRSRHRWQLLVEQEQPVVAASIFSVDWSSQTLYELILYVADNYPGREGGLLAKGLRLLGQHFGKLATEVTLGQVVEVVISEARGDRCIRYYGPATRAAVLRLFASDIHVARIMATMAPVK
jgi:hypothetical protein